MNITINTENQSVISALLQAESVAQQLTERGISVLSVVGPLRQSLHSHCPSQLL